MTPLDFALIALLCIYAIAAMFLALRAQGRADALEKDVERAILACDGRVNDLRNEFANVRYDAGRQMGDFDSRLYSLKRSIEDCETRAQTAFDFADRGYNSSVNVNNALHKLGAALGYLVQPESKQPSQWVRMPKRKAARRKGSL